MYLYLYFYLVPYLFW